MVWRITCAKLHIYIIQSSGTSVKACEEGTAWKRNVFCGLAPRSDDAETAACSKLQTAKPVCDANQYRNHRHRVGTIMFATCLSIKNAMRYGRWDNAIIVLRCKWHTHTLYHCCCSRCLNCRQVTYPLPYPRDVHRSGRPAGRVGSGQVKNSRKGVATVY